MHSGINWWLSNFPESLYQCSTDEVRDKYAARCISGYNTAKDSNVLMCSTARNVMKYFYSTTSRVERLGSMFNDYFVFVYENDSEDSTKQALINWSTYNRRVGILSENIGAESFGSVKSALRTKQLADARNKYVQFAREYYNKNKVHYIIVFDFDLPGGWSYEGIMNSLGWYCWDAVGSNGLLYRQVEGGTERIFFDSWAYREYGKPQEADPITTNLLYYNRGENLVQVNSCFGGLAIYTREAFMEDVWYQEGDCDHATFNNQLSKLKYGVYLNPSQIVLYNKTNYGY